MKRLALLAVPLSCACQPADVATAVGARMGAEARITSLAKCPADAEMTHGNVGGTTFYFADGEASFPLDASYRDFALRCFGGA